MMPPSFPLSVSPSRQRQHQEKRTAVNGNCSPRKKTIFHPPTELKIDALLDPSSPDPMKMQRDITFSPQIANKGQNQTIYPSSSARKMEDTKLHDRNTGIVPAETELRQLRKKYSDAIAKQKTTLKNLSTAGTQIMHLHERVRDLEDRGKELTARLAEYENENQGTKKTIRRRHEEPAYEIETTRLHHQKLARVATEQKRQLDHIQYLERELQAKSEQVKILREFIQAQQKEEKIDSKRKDPNGSSLYQEMILDIVIRLEDLQLHMHEFKDLLDTFDAWASSTWHQMEKDQRSQWLINEVGNSMQALKEEIDKLSMNSNSIHKVYQLEVEHSKDFFAKSSKMEDVDTPFASIDPKPPSFAKKDSPPIHEFVPNMSGYLSSISQSSDSRNSKLSSLTSPESVKNHQNAITKTCNVFRPSELEAKNWEERTRRFFSFTTEQSISSCASNSANGNQHNAIANNKNRTLSTSRPSLVRPTTSIGNLPMPEDQARASLHFIPESLVSKESHNKGDQYLDSDTICPLQKSLRDSLHHELMHESMLSFRGRLDLDYFDRLKKPWLRNQNECLFPVARARHRNERKPGRFRPDNELCPKDATIVSTRIQEEVHKDANNEKQASSSSVASLYGTQGFSAIDRALVADLSYLRVLEAAEGDIVVNRFEI